MKADIKEAENWWSERWTELLKKAAGEAFSRLRTRARKAVFEFFETGAGEIKAKVGEGTAKPWFAKVYLDALDEAAWKKITAAMAGQAVWEAKLRAGALPESSEKVFAEAGKRLFPEDLPALRSFCSRHGEAVFCFHVAALHFRFAEDFSRNPFLLFEALGMKKEALLELLSSGEGLAEPVPPAEVSASPFKEGAAGPFWTTAEDFPSALVRFVSGLEVRNVEHLPPFPFSLRGKNLNDLLAPVYHEAALQASSLLSKKT